MNAIYSATLVEEEHAATVIQRVYRGHRLRKYLCTFHSEYSVWYARKIQHTFRRHRKRVLDLEDFYEQLNEYATMVKYAFKRYLLVRKCSQRRLQQRTHRIIITQSLFRKKLAYGIYRLRYSAWLNIMALRIECHVRAFLARRRCKRIYQRLLSIRRDLLLLSSFSVPELHQYIRDDKWKAFERIVLLSALGPSDNRVVLDLSLELRHRHPSFLPAKLLQQYLQFRHWSKYSKNHVLNYNMLEIAVQSFLLHTSKALTSEDNLILQELEYTLFQAIAGLPFSKFWKSFWVLLFDSTSAAKKRSLSLVQSATESFSSTCLQDFHMMQFNKEVLLAMHAALDFKQCSVLGTLRLTLMNDTLQKATKMKGSSAEKENMEDHYNNDDDDDDDDDEKDGIEATVIWTGSLLLILPTRSSPSIRPFILIEEEISHLQHNLNKILLPNMKVQRTSDDMLLDYISGDRYKLLCVD